MMCLIQDKSLDVLVSKTYQEMGEWCVQNKHKCFVHVQTILDQYENMTNKTISKQQGACLLDALCQVGDLGMVWYAVLTSRRNSLLCSRQWGYCHMFRQRRQHQLENVVLLDVEGLSQCFTYLCQHPANDKKDITRVLVRKMWRLVSERKARIFVFYLFFRMSNNSLPC